MFIIIEIVLVFCNGIKFSFHKTQFKIYYKHIHISALVIRLDFFLKLCDCLWCFIIFFYDKNEMNIDILIILLLEILFWFHILIMLKISLLLVLTYENAQIMETELRILIRTTQQQSAICVLRMKIGSMWCCVKRISKIEKNRQRF